MEGKAEKWASAAGIVGDKRTGGARQPVEGPARRRSWSDVLGVAVCVALALFCIGVCVVIFMRTSDLQSRLMRLEQQHWDAKFSAWMQSVEQVEPVIMERLDRILEEVRLHTWISSLWTLKATLVLMVQIESSENEN